MGLKPVNFVKGLLAVTMHLGFVLFCGVYSSVIVRVSAREYSNRWTVQIDGDNVNADTLARKHGFVNRGKVQYFYIDYLTADV